MSIISTLVIRNTRQITHIWVVRYTRLVKVPLFGPERKGWNIQRRRRNYTDIIRVCVSAKPETERWLQSDNGKWPGKCWSWPLDAPRNCFLISLSAFFLPVCLSDWILKTWHTFVVIVRDLKKRLKIRRFVSMNSQKRNWPHSCPSFLETWIKVEEALILIISEKTCVKWAAPTLQPRVWGHLITTYQMFSSSRARQEPGSPMVAVKPRIFFLFSP